MLGVGMLGVGMLFQGILILNHIADLDIADLVYMHRRYVYIFIDKFMIFGINMYIYIYTYVYIYIYIFLLMIFGIPTMIKELSHICSLGSTRPFQPLQLRTDRPKPPWSLIRRGAKLGLSLLLWRAFKRITLSVVWARTGATFMKALRGVRGEGCSGLDMPSKPQTLPTSMIRTELRNMPVLRDTCGSPGDNHGSLCLSAKCC